MYEEIATGTMLRYRGLNIGNSKTDCQWNKMHGITQ